MEKIARELLRAGIQAPSGDNLQPWAFALSKEKIQILIDPKVDQSFFNFRQCATVISVGALVENLSYAAKFLGLDYSFERKIEKSNDLWQNLWQIGIFQYQQPDRSIREREQALGESAIFRRCTNRKPYQKATLEKELLQELETSLEDLPVTLHILQGKAQEELSRLIYEADIIRVERKDLHLFLHDTIRWSPDEIEQKKDGMPIETLEAGKAGEFFLKITKPWPIMNFLNLLGISKALADHTKKLALSSGALLAFCVEKFDEEAFFDVGRAMERIWLKATEKGLAVQPLAAVPLFSFRWKTGDKFSFSPKHQKLMMRIEKRCHSLGISNCAMILRIGRATSPEVYAPRKSPESFLIQRG